MAALPSAAPVAPADAHALVAGANTYVRVSPNCGPSGQYKSGFLRHLLENNVYVAWLADSYTHELGANRARAVPFAGRMVHCGKRSHDAYSRIRVGHRLVMGLDRDIWVGRVVGEPTEAMVLDNTYTTPSHRARVHHYRRRPFVRECEDRAARAAADGVASEVAEVVIPVVWEKLENPTVEQNAWCSAVQGAFVHRKEPFPAPAPAPAPALVVAPAEAPAPAAPAPDYAAEIAALRKLVKKLQSRVANVEDILTANLG